MGDFITALLVTVTSSALWEALEPAAPLVGMAILFAFGYRILRRAVGGVSKGKAKI